MSRSSPPPRDDAVAEPPAPDPPIAPGSARAPLGGVAPVPPLAPAARPTGMPAAASSVERVIAKDSFSPDEPLPAFTFPALDDDQRQELLRRVEEARPQSPSSLERVMAKESFSSDEPLPAFTFPVLDDEKKQELLQRVEAARALPEDATLQRAAVPPATRGAGPGPSARFDAARLFADLRRMGRAGSARAVKVARRWIDAACAFIDENRSRLPARLRDPLSQVRAGAILAALAALAFSALVGVIALVGAGRARTPAPDSKHEPPMLVPAPKADPVPAEIEQAMKQGGSALERLAARFPNDFRVWLELAASSSANGDYSGAVAAVGKALAADPKANEQATASDTLALAVRKRPTTDAAFELLEGPMGSAGADVLYDLSIDPKSQPPLRARAEEWVRSEAFKKAAAPDAEIAGALRYARSCSERHYLLPRAAERGGRRALDYLNLAKTPGGCGRNARKDCFPCMRKDHALKDAISAIETRLAGN